MTNLVSGQPEMVVVFWVDQTGDTNGMPMTTFKKADALRKKMEAGEYYDGFKRFYVQPKGAVRIARFKGEWL
jgi:hypothetical protein